MSEKKFEFMTGHMKNDLVEVEINGKKQYGGWTGTHKEEEDQWLIEFYFPGEDKSKKIPFSYGQLKFIVTPTLTHTI